VDLPRRNVLAACLSTLTVVLCWVPVVSLGGPARSVFGLVAAAVHLGLVDSVFTSLVVVVLLLLPIAATVTVVCSSAIRAPRLVRWVSSFAGCVAMLLGVAVGFSLRLGGSLAGGHQGGFELVFPWVVVAVWVGIGLGLVLLQRPHPGDLLKPDGSVIVRTGGLVATCSFVGLFTLWGVFYRSDNSPTEAAQVTADALASGDALGVVEALDPRERDVLLRSGMPLLQQLRRLGMIDGKTAARPTRFRESNVPIKLGRVHTLADDLRSVDTSGTLAIPRAVLSAGGTPLAKTMGHPQQIVVVRVDGRWYVSILHSAAELRRVHDKQPFPKPVESVGAANPEAAVLDMFSAVAAVDADRVVGGLDPVESAFAYQYVHIFKKQADSAKKWSGLNAIGSFPNIGLSSEVDGDRAVVKITRWSAELSLPSDIGLGTNISLDGNCVTATVEQQVSSHCGKDIPQVVADQFGVTAPNLGDLKWLEDPRNQLEFVVFRRSGKWYVAPLSSILNSLTLRMSQMKSGDVVGKSSTDQWQRIVLGSRA
jgi:hypothetical protein